MILHDADRRTHIHMWYARNGELLAHLPFDQSWPTSSNYNPNRMTSFPLKTKPTTFTTIPPCRKPPATRLFIAKKYPRSGSVRGHATWTMPVNGSLASRRGYVGFLRGRPDPIDLNWWGDASTSFGIGVTIGTYWAVWTWTPCFSPGPSSAFNIGWAEAVAVELGVRLLLSLNLHHHPFGRRFLVRSDNAGVVELISKGRYWTEESNSVLKNIHHLLTEAQISIKTTHIQSRFNVPDALSWGDIPSFLNNFPGASTQITLLPLLT